MKPIEWKKKVVGLQAENPVKMTIPYDSIENDASTKASEPQVAYGNVPLSVPHSFSSEIPEGCMSLERFGELFHQKLDACYARLQGDSKQ